MRISSEARRTISASSRGSRAFLWTSDRAGPAMGVLTPLSWDARGVYVGAREAATARRPLCYTARGEEQPPRLLHRARAPLASRSPARDTAIRSTRARRRGGTLFPTLLGPPRRRRDGDPVIAGGSCGCSRRGADASLARGRGRHR